MRRLQKILSEAGITSRRRAEEMISQGRVRVNGQVVTRLGTQADPDRDKIMVDNQPIRIAPKKVYYLFHKPENVMVTRHDPQGRPIIFDYLKAIPERINPVGRLDFDSEGLLLLTNDGQLQAHLTHPRHEVPKIYQVKISGAITTADIKKLEVGIDIGQYITRPCSVKMIKQNPHNTWLEIKLTEGKNRQVRRMIEAISHEVLRLVRVGIGSLYLGNLKKGEWRSLTPSEIIKIQKFVVGPRT